MTGEPLRTTVVITNEQGLHMRPIGSLIKLVQSFQSKVTVAKAGSSPADCRSMMDLLGLGAVQGTELTVEVCGPDQETALRALVELLQHLDQEADADSPSAP